MPRLEPVTTATGWRVMRRRFNQVGGGDATVPPKRGRPGPVRPAIRRLGPVRESRMANRESRKNRPPILVPSLVQLRPGRLQGVVVRESSIANPVARSRSPGGNQDAQPHLGRDGGPVDRVLLVQDVNVLA